MLEYVALLGDLALVGLRCEDAVAGLGLGLGDALLQRLGRKRTDRAKLLCFNDELVYALVGLLECPRKTFAEPLFDRLLLVFQFREALIDRGELRAQGGRQHWLLAFPRPTNLILQPNLLFLKRANVTLKLRCRVALLEDFRDASLFGFQRPFLQFLDLLEAVYLLVIFRSRPLHFVRQRGRVDAIILELRAKIAELVLETLGSIEPGRTELLRALDRFADSFLQPGERLLSVGLDLDVQLRIFFDAGQLLAEREACLLCLPAERLFVEEAAIQVLPQFVNGFLITQCGVEPRLAELGRVVYCLADRVLDALECLLEVAREALVERLLDLLAEFAHLCGCVLCVAEPAVKQSRNREQALSESRERLAHGIQHRREHRSDRLGESCHGGDHIRKQIREAFHDASKWQNRRLPQPGKGCAYVVECVAEIGDSALVNGADASREPLQRKARLFDCCKHGKQREPALPEHVHCKSRPLRRIFDPLQRCRNFLG